MIREGGMCQNRTSGLLYAPPPQSDKAVFRSASSLEQRKISSFVHRIHKASLGSLSHPPLFGSCHTIPPPHHVSSCSRLQQGPIHMHSRINMNISLLGGGTELIVHEVTPRKESRIRTFLTWGGGDKILYCLFLQPALWVVFWGCSESGFLARAQILYCLSLIPRESWTVFLAVGFQGQIWEIKQRGTNTIIQYFPARYLYSQSTLVVRVKDDITLLYQGRQPSGLATFYICRSNFFWFTRQPSENMAKNLLFPLLADDPKLAFLMKDSSRAESLERHFSIAER